MEIFDVKVYLAICDYGQEGPRVLAVCASRELAQARIDEPHRCAAEDHEVEEWEVDGSPERTSAEDTKRP